MLKPLIYSGKRSKGTLQMAGTWIVGQVKGNCEQLASDNIARQGFGCYLPLIPELICLRRDGRKVWVGRPLFRGYIFIDIEGSRWQSLLSTRGLFGLLGVGTDRTYPSALPDGTVEEIQQREDETGLVQLPKRKQFAQGQPVIIKDGLFKDFKGIYQGMTNKERVDVLVEYLGRKTSVLIGRELVLAA